MESLGIEISWPSKQQREKQSRIHKIKELQNRSHGKHPKAVEQGHGGRETTKAVAWAVFQHHGEGGAGHGHTHGMAVRRPTRFKIEAQMKLEVAHRSVYEALPLKWDAGSTLFDSFELNTLLKTLDEASHAPPAAQQKKLADEDDGEEAAGAMVVYSPKSPTHWTSARPEAHAVSERRRLEEAEDHRLHAVDERRPSEALHGEGYGQRHAMRYNLTRNVLKHGHDDAKDDSSAFGHWYSPKSIGNRSCDSAHHEKPAKGASHHHHHHHHHHNRWKSLLHTLHLDGANGLFHGFHKSHTQVAPHDLEKTQEQKGRSHHRDHGSDGDAYGRDRELYNGHFERNDLHASKDVSPPPEKEDDHHHHRHHHRHHPHFWKFGVMPFCGPGHLLSDNEGSDSEEFHKGHKKHHGHRHVDLRAALSSVTANLLHHHHHHDHKHEHEHRRQRDHLQGDEQSVLVEHHHHYHHHHHHVQPEGEDNEMTVQAISMRVARTSFDEKARRLSIEESGLKAPRNSLETHSIWA